MRQDLKIELKELKNNTTVRVMINNVEKGLISIEDNLDKGDTVFINNNLVKEKTLAIL